jgi:rubrerythrin
VPIFKFIWYNKEKQREELKMPEFGSAFSGLANDRKLTHEELVRAIRFMIAAEYEAIQMYTQLAESTDDKVAIAVLKDISDEERVHAGEFLKLLKYLDSSEEKFYENGTHEVEEMIEKIENKAKKGQKKGK